MRGPEREGGGADHPREPGLPARAAIRIYRWAIRMLPSGFRHRYRDEAVRDFEEVVSRRERRDGAVGVARALVGGVGDIVLRAPREQFNETRGRSAGRGGWMETLRNELKTAARSLLRRPGFSVVAIVTLALGIGANVAIFAVVNGVILKPLPFDDSEQVVAFRHHAPGLDLPELGNSEGTINFYREHSRTLESIAVLRETQKNASLGDRPERVDVVEVTPSFFSVVRTRPALGRAFVEADARPGANPVVILSHAAWTTRFGGDPEILGQTLRLDRTPAEIVGVMPERFAFPDPDIVAYLPTYVDPNGVFGTFGLTAMARVAPGVSIDAARSEIERLQPRMVDFFPNLTADFFERAQWSVTVERYRDQVVGDVASALWIILGTVAFVLVIAAANVANLFLVRAEGRQREIAVRAALGAGRGRLALVFLSESLILGIAAGVVGLGLAWIGLEALVALGPAELPRLHSIGLDPLVLGFALMVSVVASLAFGSLPVVRYLGRSFASTLREGGRSATDGRERHRARNLLVVFQLALALVLLVGSGLMLRSFQELRSVDAGVDPENVLTTRLSLGEVEDPAEAVDFYRRVADAVRALPGVREAGAINALPLAPIGLNGGSFRIESRPRAEDELPPVAMWAAVTRGAFESLGVPLLAGRLPTAADGQDDSRHVWVNETFARQFLDGAALGERVSLGTGEGEEPQWREIVGVVGDIRHWELRDDVQPMIYLPLASGMPSSVDMHMFALSVKTAGPPLALVGPVREAVASVRAEVPVTATYTMEQIVARSMADTSFTMTLLGIAALLALVLASVGIYGVIAYLVSQRTREIGVRMALGAEPADVRTMVVKQGLGVTAVGIAAGLLAAFGLTRLMTSVLFEVSATDPTTFVGVSGLLAGVALAASWIPARRATRVDPSEALRND